jgi:signal transduction histidine kinase
MARLVHDLSQPLENIGLTASYLTTLVAAGPERVRDQVLAIQRQVDRASRILRDTAGELGRLRSERDPG